MNAESGMRLGPLSSRLRRRAWFSLPLVGLLFGLGLLGWFGLRHRLLDYAWTKAIQRSENLGYQLSSKRLEFSGFSTLQIHDLAVTFQQKPLVTVAEMTAKPALLRLLTGELRLQGLHLKGLRLQAVQTGSVCNICPLLKPTQDSTATGSEPKSPINQRIYDFATQVLDRLPPDFQIKDSYVSYRNDTLITSIGLPFLTYQSNQINGRLKVRENQESGAVRLEGNLDRSSITGTLRLTPMGQKTFLCLGSNGN